jgi:hypothetical protein
MLLSDRAWQRKYSREDDNLVSRFYVPALSTAIRYDRTTGYFKAGSLSLAARGIEHLVLNGGRMRLLVGCTLDEEEVKAIERGLALAEVIEAKADFAIQEPSSGMERDALELLAWMIGKGYLEIKVAVPCDENTRRPARGSAIFHEKSGIIEDKTGDRLAFVGSINETVQGWMHNSETFNVYTSFGSGLEYLDEEETSFQRYWEDRARKTCVFELPTALERNLLQYLPADDGLPERIRRMQTDEEPIHVQQPFAPVYEDTDRLRAEFWERVRTAAQDPNGGIWVGEATSPMEAWPHQRRAFLRMYGNGVGHRPRLLIADEVGLGKTVQAGLLIRQSWMAGHLQRGLILAPANVCAQWQAELREKFALDWPIYDGQSFKRYDVATQSIIETPVGRQDWGREPYVIMSSHLARRKDRRPELLAADPWDLVIVDEAHHARNKRSGGRVEANMLMRLLKDLKEHTNGFILMSATPLQTHALELYDLLSLIGFPPEWDAVSYERYFDALSQPSISVERFEECARLFRATEAFHGTLSDADAARLGGTIGQPLSKLQPRRILGALRSQASIPRRQLSSADRAAAVRIMKRWTPVAALMSRHTRALLRRYQAEGRLAARIATRNVTDRFIEMDPAERDIYERTEAFLRETYAHADQSQRNAIGFILTIYRKRLSSSFAALARSLQGRLDRATEDDEFDLEESGVETDEGDVHRAETKARRLLEGAAIAEILEDVVQLPIDTKARALADELKQLKADGFDQTMVFTGYTDTMDGVRDWLADHTGREIICFSGRGGEIRTPEGGWRLVSRAEIKKRFQDGKGEVLLCTDAAAEGLNFQFCGSLINYDMPWNPMRVEQRIGRIDRLGQRFENIQIINLHYKDTVETAVYIALSSRIKLFEDMVGGLQPILSAVSKEIGAIALAGGHADVDSMVASRIDQTETPTVDIDDDLDLHDMPEMGVPALTLAYLELAVRDHRLLPAGYEMEDLGPEDFAVEHPDTKQKVRATLSRSYYAKHFDSAEFWTLGSASFPC